MHDGMKKLKLPRVGAEKLHVENFEVSFAFGRVERRIVADAFADQRARNRA